MLSKINDFFRNIVGYSLVVIGFGIAWLGSMLAQLGVWCSAIPIEIYTQPKDMTDSEFRQAIEKLNKDLKNPKDKD